MSERIAHRGPDDHGLETRGAVTLSARRLSIDLSSARMPMHDEWGRWAIVYMARSTSFKSYAGSSAS